MDNKVLSIVPQIKSQEENLVEIVYKDTTVDLLEADAFAFADDLPGFMAFWKEQPYQLVKFIAIDTVKTIRVIPKESINENIGTVN